MFAESSKLIRELYRGVLEQKVGIHAAQKLSSRDKSTMPLMHTVYRRIVTCHLPLPAD